MTDYSELIEEIVAKFIKTQGEDLAVRQAQKAEGIEIEENGEVVKLEKSGKKAVENVMAQFETIMGAVAYTLASSAIKEDYEGDLELPEDLQERL